MANRGIQAYPSTSTILKDPRSIGCQSFHGVTGTDYARLHYAVKYNEKSLNRIQSNRNNDKTHLTIRLKSFQKGVKPRRRKFWVDVP